MGIYMHSIQCLQKLIRLMDTPHKDIPKLSVMAMAFPYGFGALCDYADLLGDHLTLLEQRGLIVRSRGRGREYFYSVKLMDFYINEIYPSLNSEKSIQAKEAINRLISGYASLGMEPHAVKVIHSHFARKLPSGRLVLTADGIKDYPNPEKEVTLLKDIEFIGKSGDPVLVADSYINKLQKEFTVLNVVAVISKAIQVNNSATTPQRKTVAGLNTYLRNFLNRTSPAETNRPNNLIDRKDIESVQSVFNVWKEITNNPATYPDAGQVQKILAPLKNGYTLEQLHQAIRVAANDKWFSGNERRMTLSFLMAADRLQQLLNSNKQQQPIIVETSQCISILEDQVMTIFNSWTEISGSPATMPDASQHQMIVQALQLGYSQEDICQSFQSAANNEWHAGTGRFAGQGTKLTLGVLLKADILQRNLQDASVFNRTIDTNMATQGLIQVALNLKH